MRTRSFVGFLLLFALFLYFELGYLMEYDTGECPIFGTVVYNVPCRLFSLVMLFIGLSAISLFLAGKIRTSLLFMMSSFVITFFAAWTWSPSSKVLAFVGVFLSFIGLYFYPKEVETPRSLREATSFVIYAFVFLVFLLSAVSYALYFSWICWDAYSRTAAFLCSVISYTLVGSGLASPLLWWKGWRIHAVITLLANFFFMKFVLRVLPFSELAFILVVVLFVLELSGDGEFYGQKRK